jgi:hypothetical protein
MALTYTNFRNFEAVRNWYEKTKPLVSKRFTREQDVRPIGDRSRYYERIVKINDNCYALCDYDTGGRGNYFGMWKHYAPGWEPTPDDIKMMAPIVWERRADGSETVKIRNGSGSFYQHNRRYAFLTRHTPISISFRQTNVGMQFIRVVGGREYFLPKHNSMPKPVHEGVKQAHTKNPSAYTQRLKQFVGSCDGRYLMFCKDTPTSGWTHIYGEFEPKRPSAPPVDREAKAAFKQAIAEFYQWAVAITPLLGTHRDYQAEQAEKKVAKEYLKSAGVEGYYVNWYNFAHIWLPAEHARYVLTDTEHPLRMFALRHLFCHTADLLKIETDEDAKLFKSQYNRWVNKFFGFTKRGGDDIWGS